MTRNLPTLEEIATGGLPTKPGLSLDALDALLVEAEAQNKTVSAAKRAIIGYIEGRYAGDIAAAYNGAGKDFGTVRVSDGGYEIVADRPKRVEWDQTQLAGIQASIADHGDNPAEYLKTSLTVDERAYTAWPEHIRSIFEPARTTKAGATSIKLQRKEAA